MELKEEKKTMHVADQRMNGMSRAGGWMRTAVLLLVATAIVVLVLATLMGSRVAAQETASAAGMGSVAGRVVCGDTQRPARFATVVLFGVPAEVSTTPKVDAGAGEEAQMKAVQAAMESLGKTNMVQTQTGVDGAFVATDVAPGDYYVFGSAAGYVTPLNQVQAAVADGADLKKPLAGVPVVHVTADRQSSMDVTLVRGAAISGVISWDDGSPVTGAMVKVKAVKGEQQSPTQFGMLAMSGNILSLISMSDDQGHYRISGLAPGEYLVTAQIKTSGQMGLGASGSLARMMASATPLTVYAPSAMHAGDAKSVTLKGGEEVGDEAITLNLNGMHSVRGHVASIEDHHGINTGVVTLKDATDKEFTRMASLDAAGNYVVTLLPPGTYSVEVNGAEDTEPKPKTETKGKGVMGMFGPAQKTIRSYEDGKTSVIVTDADVTAPVVELVVSKGEKKDSASQLLGGMLGTN
ncbi:MAG: carboxypeptidase-like regulatory domain-containing protein [Acidobacteriota bacterium]